MHRAEVANRDDDDNYDNASYYDNDDDEEELSTLRGVQFDSTFNKGWDR